ncbi:hypothetical protein SAMN05216327_101288 [Dyadobacter sp. SG02]|uniref:hypothetical protein n=1 Tax=Dyadobacter sp. SG02 TaxID=1855291 RepID=UPI0008D216F8|nr:hypothetical protein [Dyadobacter sp. SG02]SEI40509.1 hypothetical protein SAMN05216327_101288 [Dyadobacter sp. SG02]
MSVQVLVIVYIVAVLIPLVAGTVRFRLLGMSGRVLTFQLFLTLIYISTSFYYWSRNMSNMFIFHIQTVTDYVFYVLIIYFGISNARLKKTILVSVYAFPLLSLFFTAFVNDIDENSSVSYFISYLLLICWSFLYLYGEIKSSVQRNLFRELLFWVALGYICYFSSCILVETFYEQMKKYSTDLAEKLYFITYPLAYLLHTLFTVGLLADRLFKNEMK